MEEQKVNTLENRISKLERKGNIGLWLQFFIFPLILAGMGYYFQNTVKESEKRMEQLKITQSIVNQVFTDTIYGRTIAIRNILEEVLENNELSKKIGLIIDDHLKDRVINGTPQDLIGITSAVTASGKDSLKYKINDLPAVQQKLTKYQLAKTKEREAFMFLSNGELKEAERAFNEVEEIYPSFHQAYEISNFLRKNRISGNTRNIQEVQTHIAEKLNWGASPEQLRTLSNRNNQL